MSRTRRLSNATSVSLCYNKDSDLYERFFELKKQGHDYGRRYNTRAAYDLVLSILTSKDMPVLEITPEARKMLDDYEFKEKRIKRLCKIK